MAASQFRCGLLISVGLFSLAGCDRSTATLGGNYPAVTPSRLIGLTSSHRTGKHDFEFSWTFSADSYVLQGSNIPTDLTTALLGPGSKATKIVGRWEIQDGRINFSVDGAPANPANACSMPIYSTGPVRIESPSAQYVF